MGKTSGRQTETNEPHWIEWVTGVLSSLLVGAMIGWIAWQALTAVEQPPQLSVTVTQVEKAGDFFRVEFDIANVANTSAASVTVMGEISGGDMPAETAEVTFDYVPAQSKSRGALLFRSNPAGRELKVQPAGYTEP